MTTRQITRDSGLVLTEVSDELVEWHYQSDNLGSLNGSIRLDANNTTRWISTCHTPPHMILDLEPMELSAKVEELESHLIRLEQARKPENSPQSRRKAQLDGVFSESQ